FRAFSERIYTLYTDTTPLPDCAPPPALRRLPNAFPATGNSRKMFTNMNARSGLLSHVRRVVERLLFPPDLQRAPRRRNDRLSPRRRPRQPEANHVVRFLVHLVHHAQQRAPAAFARRALQHAHLLDALQRDRISPAEQQPVRRQVKLVFAIRVPLAIHILMHPQRPRRSEIFPPRSGVPQWATGPRAERFRH